MHVRSHTELPGPIAEGNHRADALAMPAQLTTVPDIFQQAKLSHDTFHQNAPALVRMFCLSRDQARAIVATRPSCQQHQLPCLGVGVIPRGLNSCQVWQTDVTHVPEFGKSKYVHVSVDTFSGAVYASAHSGEKATNVKNHLIQAFATLGIPQTIKTDNGPTYVSKSLHDFLQQWGVAHNTGIPHSPTGQSIIERTHQTLKKILRCEQGGTQINAPAVRLSKVLFTINFLNNSFEEPVPLVVRHSINTKQAKLKENPPVLTKDPETRQIQGPFPLVTAGRGYACISTPAGPRWIPKIWVKPFLQPAQDVSQDQQQGAPDKTQPKDVTTAAWRRRRRKKDVISTTPAADNPFSLSLLYY